MDEIIPESRKAREQRFDMRMTPSVKARTWAVVDGVRREFFQGEKRYAADCWEIMLFGMEHVLRLMRLPYVPKFVKDFVRTLFRPIPEEDYVRNVKRRMEAMFGPAAA